MVGIPRAAAGLGSSIRHVDSLLTWHGTGEVSEDLPHLKELQELIRRHEARLGAKQAGIL